MAITKIAPSDVVSWLKLDATDVHLDRSVAATIGYVDGLPVVTNLALVDGDSWPEDVKLGAIMVAARLWRRRNSPNGVEAITESGATYVARHDSDISRLLQLDGFQRPQIG